MLLLSDEYKMFQADIPTSEYSIFVNFYKYNFRL